MTNNRKIECKIKARDKHFTARERREISEEVRNLVFTYNLEYIIVINNQ